MQSQSDFTQAALQFLHNRWPKFEKMENQEEKSKEDKSGIYDEFLFGLLESKRKNKKTRLFRLYFSLIGSLTILLASMLVLITLLEEKEVPDNYFSRETKNEIRTVILNDGDLNTVKHVYNSKEIKRSKITDLFLKKEKDYYPANTTLNDILNDLKVDYYLSEKKEISYLNRLEEIIDYHNQVNPFDKLEANQKFAFENIRDRLDTNYVQIQEDLNRIADEMNSKNLLVDRYLEKSNLSYWISVIALALTIILSTIQIYQNRNQRISNLLKGILQKKTEGENPENE